MSTEYFIQGYNNGTEDGLGLQEILRAFGKRETDLHNGLYRLRYDEINDCDLALTLRDDVVTHIVIYKPCGHAELYESIFDILQTGPYVIFAPGGIAPVLAQTGLASHLPDGMIDALGEPTVVQRPQEIPAAIFG